MTRQAGGDGDQVGAGRQITPLSIRQATQLVRQGRVFDLDPGRFPGMPRHPAQPPFDLVTYRSPHGQRTQGDLELLRPEANSENFGFVLELVTTSMHMGAHIDALCHVTCGPESAWHGGFRASEHLGDKGALASDAACLPPIIARGVMIDVARSQGVEMLPESHPIDDADLSEAIDRQGVEIRAGDVILLRTGQMRGWPDLREGGEAGLSLDGARWLAEHEPVAVGSDNSAVEVLPSGIPGSPQPVHVHLMVEHGIYLLEWLQLEELAAAQITEYLFICLPLKITGASGSLVRPVAVI